MLPTRSAPPLARILRGAVLAFALVGYLGVLSGTSIGAGWRLAAHVLAQHAPSDVVVHEHGGKVHTHDGVAHTHTPEPEESAPVVIPTLDPQWILSADGVPVPLADEADETPERTRTAAPEVWRGVETPPPQREG